MIAISQMISILQDDLRKDYFFFTPELVLSPEYLPDWAVFFHSLEDLFQMAGKCFFHLPSTSINFQPAGHFFAGISGT